MRISLILITLTALTLGGCVSYDPADIAKQGKEIQIEHDQNVQAQQQYDREESVRKDLLNRGYSPEETEKMLSHDSSGK